MPYVLSVFLHVVCAAFWIGGMLFLPLVMLPAVRDNPQRVLILYKTGLKFRFYGWIVVALLLTTGLLNMHFRGIPWSMDFFMTTQYGKLMSVKLFLFAGILLVSATHDFLLGKQAVEQMMQGSDRMRKIASWSGRIMLLLALAAALIGVLLSRGGVWIE